MSTIAIGDIHGNLPALQDLLRQVSKELTAGDTVVFLGDYIDRGPDTCACIDAVLRFQDEAPCAVVTLIGNHEDWLLRTLRDHTRHSWLLGMEGLTTIMSYSPQAGAELRRATEAAGLRLLTDVVELPYDLFFDAVPRRHLEFLQTLAVFHRTPDAICVHGGLDPYGGPIEHQPHQALIWGVDSFPRAYEGPDTVIYGHHDNGVLTAEGWPLPRIEPSAIGIDTISHGVLTAIRVADRRVFQSARYVSPS